MTRSESFIVTKDGDNYNLLETDVLKQYAIKSTESNQIDVNGDEAHIVDTLDPLYNPQELTKLLEMNTWHEKCVDAIASDSSGIGFNLVPKKGVDNPSDEEQKLLNEFFENIRPSVNKVLYKRMYDTRAIGYGAIEVIRHNGQDSPIKDLKYIPSHTLKRMKDGVRAVQEVGINKVYFVLMDKNKEKIGKNWVYYNVDKKTGEKSFNTIPEENRANEIIFTSIHTPRTKYYGVTKIVPAIRAIYGDIHRANYNSSFFKNFGMPAFAVVVTGDFEPDLQPGEDGYDEKKTLKYNIKEQIKEVIKNPHSAITIMVPTRVGEEDTKVEVKIEPLSVETKEASFRLYRKDNRDEILAAHGMDPNRVGVYESGKLNGSNSDSLDNAYKTTLINSLKADNEDDINYYVLRLGLGINDWEFRIVDNDPNIEFRKIETIKAKMEIAVQALQNGIKSPNEAREYLSELGLQRIDDSKMDEFYFNGQLLGSTYVPPNGENTVYKALESEIFKSVDKDDARRNSSDEDSEFVRSLKHFRESRKIS